MQHSPRVGSGDWRGRQAWRRAWAERANEHGAEEGRYHITCYSTVGVKTPEWAFKCKTQSRLLFLKHRSEVKGGRPRILITAPYFRQTSREVIFRFCAWLKLSIASKRAAPLDAMVDYSAHIPVMKTEPHNPNFHHSWHGVRRKLILRSRRPISFK